MRPTSILLALLTGIALPLPAQAVTGSIQGLVIQVASREPAPGVLVRITQPRLGVERVAITDALGRFRMLLLPPETYTLELGTSTFRALPLKVHVGTEQPAKAVLWVQRGGAPDAPGS